MLSFNQQPEKSTSRVLKEIVGVVYHRGWIKLPTESESLKLSSRESDARRMQKLCYDAIDALAKFDFLQESTNDAQETVYRLTPKGYLYQQALVPSINKTKVGAAAKKLLFQIYENGYVQVVGGPCHHAHLVNENVLFCCAEEPLLDGLAALCQMRIIENIGDFRFRLTAKGSKTMMRIRKNRALNNVRAGSTARTSIFLLLSKEAHLL